MLGCLSNLTLRHTLDTYTDFLKFLAVGKHEDSKAPNRQPLGHVAQNVQGVAPVFWLPLRNCVCGATFHKLVVREHFRYEEDAYTDGE